MLSYYKAQFRYKMTPHYRIDGSFHASGRRLFTDAAKTEECCA
jgi:hypothetical protein